MNVSKLKAEDAFSEGADLWVIADDPELEWWEKLDFKTHHLLTKNHLHQKTSPPSELVNIVNATNLKQPEKIALTNYVLLGTADHFFNKWVLVWSKMSVEELADTLTNLSTKLNFSTVRFFSNSDALIKALQTRPMASSYTISYIENT